MLIIKLLICFYSLKAIVYLFIRQKKVVVRKPPPAETPHFSVDIILPMYNEETVIVSTIKNLLNIDYPNFRIIAVDDGSSDNTLQVVTAHFNLHPQVLILAQENAGKSVALNNAIHASRSDIVICMDADTIVRPDVINKFIPHFYDDRVAAVAGNIRVGNRKNWLTLLQHMEYMIIPNFERIVLGRINCITGVPGALGAFRRSVLVAVGGYATDILTEDVDLSLKIQSKNFLIRNAPEAIACTEVPLGLKMYLLQRVRWKTGAVQVLWKYRWHFLSHPNKTLTYLVIPWRWVFNLFISVIAPFADYYFFYDLLFLHSYASVPYYVSFVLIDALICTVILMRWKEPLSTVLLVIPQRFIIRQLTFVYHLLIIYKFLIGNLFRWNKIVRYGSIKLD